VNTQQLKKAFEGSRQVH